MHKHAPLVTKTITVRPNSPWYTEDIGVEKSTRRRFERRWRRTLLPEHRLASMQIGVKSRFQ